MRGFSILRLLLGACFLLLFPGEACPETRRALLVGIDTYQPAQTTTPPAGEAVKEKVSVSSPSDPVGRDEWYDLSGAVNDVRALREILIARYGFTPDNIRVLTNTEATRAGILTAIQQHLVEPAAPGDIQVFAYAGHGSQVTNSHSPELDKKDETIVPVDANQGAWDIRDKELRRLFNDILDKGAALTVFFDSCHSGSVARGLVPVAKARFLPPDPRDIGDVASAQPDDTRPAPEERGALIFSAAQDHQLAYEATDEDNGTPHGAFSLALLRVLRTVNVTEPAQQIFRRVKALLQTNGRRQEPVLAGLVGRRQQALFGAGTKGLPSRTTVAVLRAPADGVLELQGGWAAGLREQTELKKVDASGTVPVVRVRVEQVQGWSRATARVIAGDPATVHVGDLFTVDRWAAPQRAALRVWLPASALTHDEVSRLGQELALLRTAERITWIEDPTDVTPTHVVSWNGSAWILTPPVGQAKNLGETLTAQAVREHLTTEPHDTVKLFVYLPPSRELVSSLHVGSVDSEKTHRAIVRVPSPQQAQYLLVGRLSDTGVEYAWVLPAATQGRTTEESSLPVRTDWISVRNGHGFPQAAGVQLTAFAQRIARIRAWLTLEAPADTGQFPYTLAFTHTQIGETLAQGTVLAGDEFHLVLQADAQRLKEWVDKRYVYVFVLDSFGNTALLFPSREQGNVGNRLPYQPTSPPPAEISLGTQIRITPPLGRDTYFLLTSRDPIEPGVFDTQGVRTRDKAPANPLDRLLYWVGSDTRGAAVVTPVEWSIATRALTSTPKH